MKNDAVLVELVMGDTVNNVIETPRLSLRRLRPDMFGAIYHVAKRNFCLLNRNGIWLGNPVASSFEEAECRHWLRVSESDWENGRQYEWGIFGKSDRAFMGCTGVHGIETISPDYYRVPKYRGELSCWVDTKRQRRGIAFESRKAVLQELRECHFSRVVVKCHAENIPPQRLAEKLGFSKSPDWGSNEVSYFIDLRRTKGAVYAPRERMVVAGR